jgi:hypothetical protein
MKASKYPNGYLPKIEYYTKEIAKLAFSLQYGNPKYVGGLSTQINNRMKRLEYFLKRHCEESGGVVGVL